MALRLARGHRAPRGRPPRAHRPGAGRGGAGGEPTDEEDDEDEVRFTLTAEAGLNDGLAFPFVLAAVALAGAGGVWAEADWGHWFGFDLVARAVIAVVIGILLGRLLGWMFFRAEAESFRLSEHMEGFVALAATFLSYGLTELAHGYGFVAVFVTACAIRAAERGHGYHKVLHGFTEQIERLLTAALLFLLGHYLAATGIEALTWPMLLLALALIVVVRPVTGWIAQLGFVTGPRERVVAAVFGLRGIGSLFYLAYALGHHGFEDQARELWVLTATTVALSVVLHGASATPVIRRLDRLREVRRPTRRREPSRTRPGGPGRAGPTGAKQTDRQRRFRNLPRSCRARAWFRGSAAARRTDAIARCPWGLRPNRLMRANSADMEPPVLVRRLRSAPGRDAGRRGPVPIGSPPTSCDGASTVSAYP